LSGAVCAEGSGVPDQVRDDVNRLSWRAWEQVRCGVNMPGSRLRNQPIGYPEHNGGLYDRHHALDRGWIMVMSRLCARSCFNRVVYRSLGPIASSPFVTRERVRWPIDTTATNPSLYAARSAVPRSAGRERKSVSRRIAADRTTQALCNPPELWPIRLSHLLAATHIPGGGSNETGIVPKGISRSLQIGSTVGGLILGDMP